MARVFVRLKLALLRNGFRRGWQQAVGTVVAVIYAAPLMIGGAIGLALLGRRTPLDTVAGPVLIVVLSILWLGWIVGPLLAFGMDETLNPRRLQLLPLRRRQLMAGLLAASVVGVGPLATIGLLCGVVFGFLPPRLSAPLVVLGVGLQFLLCITAARAVTTALSRRLASRRGRDVMTVAAALFGLLIAAAGQAPRLLFDADNEAVLGREMLAAGDRAADALSLLPPGWAARGILAAAGGDLLGSLAWLAAAAGAVAGFLWWWARSLGRMLDSATTETVVHHDDDLFPALLRWLPRTRLGAGIAKDVRYAWRVPQLRVQYLMTMLVVGPFAVFAISRVSVPAAVLAAPVVLLLLGTTGFNMFGADRGAVWMLDATGPAPRTDLTAKSLAASGLAVPIVAVVAVVVAAVTGGWSYVPAALLLALGAQGVVAGVGVVVSVRAPFPLPDSPTNVFAANAGAGCAAVLVQGGGLLAELLLIAPVVVGVVLTADASKAVVTAVAAAGAVWGLIVWRIGMTIATKRLSERAPEFVAALQPRAG